MPLYTFENKKTGETFDVRMSIAEREVYIQENPHLQQIITEAPGIGDPVRLGLKKPDANFRDVLKKAKAAHKHNTINDF